MKTNDIAREVSLSACSDLQRAWEGPKGSLTTVLCNFLSQQNLTFFVLRETEMVDRRKAAFAIISYRIVPYQVRHSPRSWLIGLHLHLFSFESHDNHLALHEYTRQQRKKGSDFDGELNNFQAPQLSSLAKLVSIIFLFG